MSVDVHVLLRGSIYHRVDVNRGLFLVRRDRRKQSLYNAATV